MVRVEGMTAQAWEMEGRSGMAFRAAAIRSAKLRPAAGRRRRRDGPLRGQSRRRRPDRAAADRVAATGAVSCGSRSAAPTTSRSWAAPAELRDLAAAATAAADQAEELRADVARAARRAGVRGRVIAVARRQTAAEAWAVLVGGALGGVWRWRLELALVGVPSSRGGCSRVRSGRLGCVDRSRATVAAVVVTPGARGALWRWLRARGCGGRGGGRGWTSACRVSRPGGCGRSRRASWCASGARAARRSRPSPRAPSSSPPAWRARGPRAPRPRARGVGHRAAGPARSARRRDRGLAVGGRDRAAVAVGADPGRRRRARRHGHDGAARAQRAAGRRARRGQERGAVDLVLATAALDPTREAVAARRQARRAGRRGQPCAERLAGPNIDEAIALLRGGPRGDGAPLPRAARDAARARSPARTGCRCTWSRATSWRST